MAETVGRVDFIVSLDGRTLPAQAKLLAEEVGKAGKPAGDNFAKEFESSFDRNLSKIGDRLAKKLDGKLAAQTFSSDFNDVLTTRFRTMQHDVANILSDKAAFRDFASGFSTVDEAVGAVTADLEKLRTQTVSYKDAEGELVKRQVLTAAGLRDFSAEARRLGADLQATLTKEKALTDEHDRLEASLQRTIRLIGDQDIFREYAKSVGGTEQAFTRLRKEVEGTGTSLGHSRVEVESWIDKLETTRNTVEKVDQELSVLERHPNRIAALFEGMFQKIGSSWARTDSTVRLVVGLIAGAGDQVAALGSAVGAEAIGVGAAAAEGLLGVGALIVAFTALNTTVAKAMPALKPVVAEFAGFKSELKDLRAEMALATFGALNGDFTKLTTAVHGLTPSLLGLSSSAGSVFDGFVKGLQPGTQGFIQLQKLIDHSTQDFPKLGAAAGIWSVSLLRALNEANPLVQNLISWITRLGTEFDNFTRSANFEVWVRNAQTVFGSLGKVLDATGQALNGLANPASVQQLSALLDNLAHFIPTLGAALQVIGALNPLGLAVQVLDDIGTAIAPLLPSLTQLATVLGNDLSLAVSGFAGALTPLAVALVPVVTGLTALISLVPPQAITALGAAMVVFAAQAAIAAGANGLAGLAASVFAAGNAFSKFAGPLDSAANGMERFSGVVGKLGGLGILVAGSVAVGVAISGWIRQIQGLDQVAAQAVSSGDALSTAYAKIALASGAASTSSGDMTLSMKEETTGLKVLAKSGSDWTGVLREGFISGSSEASVAADKMRTALSNLDAPLAQLAQNNLPAAADQFGAWAREAHASGTEITAMINTMPQFKAALEQAATQQGVMATNANLAQIALHGMTDSQRAAADVAVAHKEALLELSGAAVTGRQNIDDLANSIRGIGSATLDSRDAQRQFQAAIDDATTSVKTNGASLDITTDKGRANQAAVDAIASSSINAAAAIFKQTGQQDAATGAIQKGRDALINQLKAMGLSDAAAQQYADQLGLIPANIGTILNLNTGPADASLNAFYAHWNGKHITLSVSTNANANGDVVVSINGTARGKFAAGGILTGPRTVLAGEAGPEAIVPLRRPLSQVDPAVRGLSAIAQGMPTFASGGVVTGGSQFTLLPGSVTVYTQKADAEEVARDVVDEIFARLD